MITNYRGYLNDYQIRELAEQGMLTPFHPQKVSQHEGISRLSYGVGSYGYDITLSPLQFEFYIPRAGLVMDPKRFDPSALMQDDAGEDEMGQFFILPPHTTGLGATPERFAMPSNVFGVVEGKSTYARLGLIVNVTPIEPGWEGYLTLEISNLTPNFTRIYANEGIAQVRFYAGEPCQQDYIAGGNKYRDQPEAPVHPRI